MVLFILALIVLLLVFVAVASLVMACMLVRRNWHWLRPAAVLGLVLLVSLGIFDAMAANNAARSAEEATRKQTDKDLFGEPGEVAASPHQIQLDPEAPQWTRRPPRELLSTAQKEIEVTVHAGPCMSRTACEAELMKELSVVVGDYIRAEFDSSSASDVSISADFIRKHLVKATHDSVTQRKPALNSEPEDMVDMYALVKFDPASRKELQKLWRESVVQKRMKTAAAGLAGVLGVLTLGWAVLRRTPKAARHDVGHRVV